MLKALLMSALLFFMHTLSCAQANNTENLGFNPPYLKWRKINTPTGKIIYQKGLDSIALRMAGIMNSQRINDQKIVGSGNTKKVPVILQNLTVFPEGFSTPAPWRNEYFISPPQSLFQGPTPWTDLLTIHEYRHTQQFHMSSGGFTWLFKILAGQTGWLVSSLVNQPLWFREGDAVTAETELTKGGRGRLPRFNMETKALLLSGYHFNYEKASYGISFKDFVPNPYRPGFYMTSKLRRDFGDTIWQKILHDTYHKGLVYSFNRALKKNTGYSATKLYDQTISELDSFWKIQNARLSLTGSRPVTQPESNDYVNYRFPHFLPDGSILCLKNSFDEVNAFTIIDTTGREKKLFNYGLYSEDHLMLSMGGNLLTWAEATYDARWGNISYSVVKTYNTQTGESKTLTKKSKYFAPTPSSDGKKIATIKVDEFNHASLVVLNSADGSVLREWPNKNLLVQPRWSDDDQLILAIAVNNSGNSLISVSASSGIVKTLISETTVPLSRPFVKGEYVFFTAAYSGIDNIYALHLPAGKFFQVSSVKFGAYEPAVSSDGKKLIYSSYMAKGYQLEVMDLNPALWKEVTDLFKMKPSQPYAYETKANDLAVQSFHEQYHPEKFNAFTNGLFNVYGWFPYLAEDQYGVQFLAQNIMNTLKGSITPFYNSLEKTLGVKLDLDYAAFYPVLHVASAYQSKRSDDILDTTFSEIYQQSWNERYATAGLFVPFNFSRNNYRTHLKVGGDFGPYRIDFLDSSDAPVKELRSKFNAYGAAATFSRLSQRARRQVQSPWAQLLEFNYKKTIDHLPEQLSLGVHLFFPGLSKTHSFNIHGLYKIEEIENTYRFSGLTVMPRGYEAEPFDKIYVTRINYELPLWYPDIAAGGFAFFQRLRTNVFFDHSVGNRRSREYQMNSAGAELFIDLRALRLFGMTVGFRYNNIFNKGEVNTTPFQFFVSRFELQN